MPRSRRFRRRPRRRRRRGKASLSRVVSAGPGPLPDSYTAELSYHDMFNLTGAAVKTQVFRSNSCFDPDFTNIGHQPFGFDQLAALYNRYRVDAIGYRVSVANLTATGATVVVLAKNELSAPATIGTAIESPRARVISLGAKGGMDTKQLSGWYSNAKITGVTKTKYRSDDRYSALVSADPAEALGLMFVGGTTDQTTTVSLDFAWTLKYRVTFFDRIQLTQS